MPTFSWESAHLDRALSTLRQTLDGLGAPWGADAQGTQFGDAYTPQRDALFRATGVLVQGLEGIHEGLSAHTDNHVHGDRHTKSTFRH
ncbi:WXG100 family type VII secretion target [Streptomyces sp. NPDC001380]|uniref:WXG100 family type VII secretion target n=1 Tax=Streptomyces sp. NPDC001380 TaxID=3364566 RepID=UPI003693A3E1